MLFCWSMQHERIWSCVRSCPDYRRSMCNIREVNANTKERKRSVLATELLPSLSTRSQVRLVTFARSLLLARSLFGIEVLVAHSPTAGNRTQPCALRSRTASTACVWENPRIVGTVDVSTHTFAIVRYRSGLDGQEVGVRACRLLGYTRIRLCGARWECEIPRSSAAPCAC